jgi:chromosome segregation ATPase
MTVGRVRKALELNKKGKLPPPPEPKPSTKAAPAEVPVEHTEEDKLDEMKSEMQFIAEENAKLKDKLAVMTMHADDEAQAQVATTLEELRAQVKDLEIQLNAVTISRNDFQNKFAEAVKQINYWKKRAEKTSK